MIFVLLTKHKPYICVCLPATENQLAFLTTQQTCAREGRVLVLHAMSCRIRFFRQDSRETVTPGCIRPKVQLAQPPVSATFRSSGSPERLYRPPSTLPSVFGPFTPASHFPWTSLGLWSASTFVFPCSPVSLSPLHLLHASPGPLWVSGAPPPSFFHSDI